MRPSIEVKNTADLKHNQQPTAHTLRDLPSARSEVQKNARDYATQYWTILCESIEKASDTGNLREMNNGIKLTIGPSVRKLHLLSLKMVPSFQTRGNRWTDGSNTTSNYIQKRLK